MTYDEVEHQRSKQDQIDAIIELERIIAEVCK